MSTCKPQTSRNKSRDTQYNISYIIMLCRFAENKVPTRHRVYIYTYACSGRYPLFSLAVLNVRPLTQIWRENSTRDRKRYIGGAPRKYRSAYCYCNFRDSRSIRPRCFVNIHSVQPAKLCSGRGVNILQCKYFRAVCIWMKIYMSDYCVRTISNETKYNVFRDKRL